MYAGSTFIKMESDIWVCFIVSGQLPDKIGHTGSQPDGQILLSEVMTNSSARNRMQQPVAFVSSLFDCCKHFF